MRRIVLSLGLAAAVVGPGFTGIGAAEAADVTVTFTDRATPATLTVAPGTTVTFSNQSGDRRRVRSEDGPAEFDSGNIEFGGRWSVVLQGAGTYPYVDDRDRDNTAYHGTITVGPAPQPGSPSPGTPAASPAPSAPTTASVAILDRSFAPAAVTVAPGGTVSWTNQSQRDHTVTGAAFDSGGLASGGRFSHIFPSSGTFTYICDFHPEMRATVTVAGGGSGAPPGMAPPAPDAAPTPPARAAEPGESAAPTPTTTGGPTARRQAVAVIDYAFRPVTLSARVGDTVVWTNQGRAPHTATAAGVFDTGMFRAGEQRTTALTTAGTFRFACAIHPEMTGEVRVAAAPGGSSPGAAAESAPATGNPAATGSGSVTTTPPTTPATPPDEHTMPSTADVSVADFSFEPAAVRLRTGGTVTWRLTGLAPHTASAVGGSFNSGLLEPAAVFSHRFDAAGTYEYVCAFHPQMTGTIEVGDDASALAGGSAAAGDGADPGGEQAAVDLTGDTRPEPTSWTSLLAGLLAVAALLTGTGALLYGSSRMVAAGEGH